MGYKELIKREVKSAFNRVGNLAVDVTLSKKDTGDFNFSTMSVATTTPVLTIVKGIMTEKKKRGIADPSKTTKVLTVMFLKEVVTNISEFDLFTIEGVVYKPERPFTDDGFVIEVQLSRSE